MKRREFLQNITVGTAIVFEENLSGCASSPRNTKPQQEVTQVLERRLYENSQEKITFEQVTVTIQKLESRFGLKNEQYALIIDPSLQKLYLIKDKIIIETYTISTGKKGIGNKTGSQQTPFGTHRIKEKLGNKMAIGTILVGEGDKNGTIAPIISDPVDTAFDFVTTRLMRLDGQERGINKGGDNDSYSRDIYIHGTPEEGLLGQPTSHGCIRMKNTDIIKLFDLIPPGTLVEILNNIQTNNR